MNEEQLEAMKEHGLTRVGGFYKVPSASDIKALATEVLASRRRRCGACAWWGEAIGGLGKCRHLGLYRQEDWSCADFTPKAEP
jgi:hypothetical protein